MSITISNSQRFVARVFSQKHSLTSVGNVGIYGVGTDVCVKYDSLAK